VRAQAVVESQHSGPQDVVAESLQLQVQVVASNVCPAPQDAAVRGQAQVHVLGFACRLPSQWMHAPLSQLS
jgi:hypothetical protein